MNGEPHYTFAYRTLLLWTFVGARALRRDLQADTFGARLQRLWPGADLFHEQLEIQGAPAALVRLPPPTQTPQAYLLLLIFTSPTPRYFSLERSEDGETILGEWFYQRRGCLTLLWGAVLCLLGRSVAPHIHRLSYGLGPPPDRNLFIQAVSEALRGEREVQAVTHLS